MALGPGHLAWHHPVDGLQVRRWLGSEQKYRNTWTPYNGQNYQSKAESRHAAELDLMKAAREIDQWVGQARFPLIVNGQLLCVYVVDFLVRCPDGRIEAHEVKGQWTKDALIKSRLFSILYPDVPLRIFGRSPPTGRGSSSSGGAGAAPHTLARPKDWFDGSRST
jgi:hypothetical protein